ncbi:mitochondrial ribosomal large subunit component [Coelomomyces lativittatus]|nr:mitochondrial ribosomal large subunit component [Coelomomyces lativittatus]KAJ1507771.1 mitochondrial ribosomal large subunit component [Coelomomyces lativittatus]KAJ1508828.1 mitochondrial ribosomal large subunit component [Coelomomyces lativittatus]
MFLTSSYFLLRSSSSRFSTSFFSPPYDRGSSLLTSHVSLRGFAKEIIPPRRRAFRKASKGRIPVPTGGSMVGTQLMYGRFGLKVTEGTRLTAAQLESARRVLRRKLKDVNQAQCWLRVFPDIPVTKKGTEIRMGKGKGALDHYMCRVSLDRIVFEIDAPGLKWVMAKEALIQAGTRLPVPVKLVSVQSEQELGKILPALCNIKE